MVGVGVEALPDKNWLASVWGLCCMRPAEALPDEAWLALVFSPKGPGWR